jgi:hypothetical protein
MSRPTIDLTDPARFREGLLDGVRQAIKEGARRIDQKTLGDGGLHATLIANARAGSPIFSGVSIWRGSKDPDVERGTFDPTWKHGSPSSMTAIGYAQGANSDIGFNPKSTAGWGMVARYDIDESMRFHSNFGIEQNKPGRTLAELEKDLTPLVAAYLKAEQSHPDHPEDMIRPEEQAIRQYIKLNMYEASVPAELKAAQKWLSVPVGEVLHQLVEFSDSSPQCLHDVAISLVEARRLEIDVNATRQALMRMKQATPDAWKENEQLAQKMRHSIGALEAELDERLRSDRAAPATLDEAIESRQLHQQAMNLTRLTNSVGHSTNTATAGDRAVSGAVELCEQASLGRRRQQDFEKLDAAHKALVSLESASSNLSKCAKLLMQNAADGKKIGDQIKESQGRESKLNTRRFALDNQILQAKAGLVNKLYYATVGRGELSAWVAERNGVAKSLQAETRTMGKLCEGAEASRAERRALEGDREKLIEHHQQHFNTLKGIEEVDELRNLSPGASKAVIANIAGQVKEKLDLARESAELSRSCESKLDHILEGLKAGQKFTDAYQSMARATQIHSGIDSDFQGGEAQPVRKDASMSL